MRFKTSPFRMDLPTSVQNVAVHVAVTIQTIPIVRPCQSTWTENSRGNPRPQSAHKYKEADVAIAGTSTIHFSRQILILSIGWANKRGVVPCWNSCPMDRV